MSPFRIRLEKGSGQAVFLQPTMDGYVLIVQYNDQDTIQDVVQRLNAFAKRTNLVIAFTEMSY